MDGRNPIYSEQTQCQDCYKCLRECPVKAIRFNKSQANVIPESCIVCGHCVSVCPSGAKKVRDDSGQVTRLIAQGKRVLVSLAPSFASEFPEASPGQLIHALRRLGFHAVSETALGAQLVSSRIATGLEGGSGRRVLLSSACPVAVEYVGRYLPQHTSSITPILSPLLAHCKLLKEQFGPEVAVVFVGPCIAKKLEARAHPELLDCVLTFEDLRTAFEREGIVPADEPVEGDDVFVPESAAEGALYPIEGGMIEATRLNCRNTQVRFMSLSGIGNIEKALKDLHPEELSQDVFLELLACEGGCINGPKVRARSTIESRLKVLDHASFSFSDYPRVPRISIASPLEVEPVREPVHAEDEIRKTLLSIGKPREEDNLNCGGCGYHSCRELASAILSGKAEPEMCVSYMRKLALKKANAILQTVPYAIVLVNEHLKVVECNEEFIRLGGEDTILAGEVCQGLEGAALQSILPFCDLFESVLDNGEDIIRKYVDLGDSVLSVTIFTLEPHRIVGAILIDVTGTELRRQQIVDKAQQVIQNVLSNVQDIAFRLGKSAAESELILNSIVDGFAPARYDRPKGKTR
jgi:iron only hydrogenase large subunit-like protein